MRFSISSLVVLCISALLLAGCSSQRDYRPSGSKQHVWRGKGPNPFAGKGSAYYSGKGKIPFGGGKYFVGNPYKIAGRTWVPHEQPGYDKVGIASWYGEAFHARKTSNGEWFDMNTLTAAHATLPLPSYAMVTNMDNGRRVIVRINDRGPFVDTRIIDLSKKAADVLGYRDKGKTRVRVKLIGPAPTRDSNAHMVAMNQAMNNGASMNQIAAMTENPNAIANVQVAQTAPAPKAKPRAVEASVQQASLPSDEAVSTPGGFIVRVAVFHSIDNAKAAYASLASLGPTQIVKAVGANGPLYRVQIGPLNTQADAERARENAIANGFEDPRIVETFIQQVAYRETK
ncbi:MAG: septal ring lytic transglycosylase RlpA family protein [Alphaproteobacteria bacterium]|nr:septal ring lytic transglycosylase RlpA family protein [Alphaproteobacteria bacterium]